MLAQFGRTAGTHGLVLCCTLDSNIEGKVGKDAEKLASTSRPERVIYCYSKHLTEHKIDELTADIWAAFAVPPSVTFVALKQLAALAVQYPAVIEKYYRSEQQAIDAMLTRFETGIERDDAGLRLALMTLASEDARLLREDISQKAVLQVLHGARAPIESEAVALQRSNDLRLARPIQKHIVESALVSLHHAGHVEKSGKDNWSLTEQGKAQVDSLSSAAATDILQGAHVIRTTLETLTGYTFTDDRFATLWSTLLDYWSHLFHTNGLAVISAINDSMGSKASTGVQLQELVSKGAAQIRASIAIPEMGEVIEQAVIDILTERSGPAFEWLSKVCERFVALCSLALEASSTEEIRRVIARHKLMLDSDIVITALCQGERGHGATKDILAKWTRLGGRILLPEPVLEEVAYHAYISQRDFQEMKQLAPGLKELDLRRYCSNAFVRAFYSVENDQNQWPTFRAMYAGDEPHDYSKILEVMSDQIIVEFIPSNFDSDLAARIKLYLLAISSEQEQTAAGHFGDPGRLGRDGQILATIASTRALERRAGSDSRVVLLSSSTRLRMADEKFREQLGTPEAVISRGALSYLIALVPEAGLGVGTLRKALFDFGETARLADTERFALRVIRAAGTYTMPWAQRSHLRRQLEKNIRQEAEKAGVSAKQFRMKFLAGDEAVRPEHLIAKTIKEMALADPEKSTLRTKVRELERQLKAATTKVAPPRRRSRRKQQNKK